MCLAHWYPKLSFDDVIPRFPLDPLPDDSPVRRNRAILFRTGITDLESRAKGISTRKTRLRTGNNLKTANFIDRAETFSNGKWPNGGILVCG